MSGVDNRIVTMKFDNKEFEQNAKTSLTTIQKIKESMNFGSIANGTVRALGQIDSALSKIGLKTPFSGMITTANKGLDGVGVVLDKLGLKNPFSRGVQGAAELQKATQDVAGPRGIGALEGGITAVSSKFIALSTIAITALSNITNRAVNAGLSFAKSFTIQPVLDGLHEYETNLQAIQTVQANTDRPLPEINKALQDLNTYSDQTIYNFGQMAKNVGTFTAAGVDLQTSVSSIKGIANLAALSGSSSEQAATAMYQLSQAISSGRVGLQDWNSVVNAGMGGKKLQNALLQTAVAMGKIEKSSVKLSGPMKKLTVNGQSFRESIMAKPGQESWLSSDILVNTLASLDGRFSKNYQLSLLNADGTKKFTAKQVEANVALARTNLEKKNGVKLSDEQFKALAKMSDSATAAATQVKTLGQVFDIAKETIGSGWSASFQNIFGNLNEAKKLFTDMSNGLGDLIRANALARNNLLAKWKKIGGRDTLIDGLKLAWNSFHDVIQAVAKGFRDIFPRKTAQDLLGITLGFRNLMLVLRPSQETLAYIRNIAKGVFAVLDIGKTILFAAAGGFKTLFGAVGGGDGSFLKFLAHISLMIVRFDRFLKESGVVTAFFQGLAGILAIPLAVLRGVADAIGALFDGFDSATADKMGAAVDGIGNRLSGLEVIGERIKSFFQNLGGIFERVGKAIGTALANIGPAISDAFTSQQFGRVLDTINTGLFAALVLMIKNFFNKGIKIDGSTGLIGSIKETLGSVTSAFSNMQQNLKANILLKIAVALGVMAGSLLILSTIDPKALQKAMIAMTAGFAILIGAMASLLKVMGPAGLVQLYVVTSALTKMSFAILLMALALKTLAGINFGDMVRGLVGMAAMLAIITKVMIPLAANSKGMVKAAFSLILLGTALNIMAVALKLFATMSWEEMIKGLAGLTGTLIALAIGLRAMPELKAEAIGLIALGVAINLIAVALKVFATMSWEEIAKGAVTLASSLLIIGAAIKLMPKTMILQAAGLLVLSVALNVLAGALKIMATMGWEEIGKGLTVLAGSMLILAAALKVIGPTAPLGAAGILITAAALGILAPVLLTFGAMKWSSIAKSLTVLTAIFVILGVAANTIGPGILLLGAGIALIGAGLALMGTAALAAATAFGIVVAAGTAGISILAQLLATLIAAIGPAFEALGVGIVNLLVVISKAQPEIAAAFQALIGGLLDGINANVPKFGQAMLTLLNTLLNVLIKGVPRIATAGYKIVIGLLTALKNNIGKIVDVGVAAVTEFIRGIGRNAGPLADAAYKAVIDLMKGLRKAIDDNSEEFGAEAAKLGIAIGEGVLKGLKGFGGQIKDYIVKMGKDALKGIKDFFSIGSPSKVMRDEVGRKIVQGGILGVQDEADGFINEIANMGKNSVDKMSEIMRGVEDAFAMDPNLSPTITPVLDLSTVSRDATKMSTLLTNTPITPSVSYQTASDISSMTQTSNGSGNDGGSGEGGSGMVDKSTNLTLELHSPKTIDSVEAWRAGKSLISLAKEALDREDGQN